MAEADPPIQTCILQVKINCCSACPKKLKRYLLKIDGVQFVDLDTKRNLVQVNSDLDPMGLINKIKKLGKEAKLVPGIEETIHNENDENIGEQDEEEPSSGQNYRKDQAQNHAPQHHQHENYVPPPREFPPHICRDVHCRIHRRDDSFIYDRVMPMNYGGYPWGSSYFPTPPYGHYDLRMPPPGYGGGYGPIMMPPAGYGGGYGPTMMPPARYGGGFGPRMMPPAENGSAFGPRMMPPAGYGGIRMGIPPMARIDCFTDYYNDTYNKECSIM